MSEAEAWLRGRLAGAPPTLLEVMVDALGDDAEASVPDALAAGALRLYESLLGGAEARDDALPLLAADSLMTHALEAQAEADPAGVPALVRRFGAAGRLGELAAALPPLGPST